MDEDYLGSNKKLLPGRIKISKIPITTKDVKGAIKKISSTVSSHTGIDPWVTKLTSKVLAP